ncbi:hypothetical protein [Metallibacterium sp.]
MPDDLKFVKVFVKKKTWLLIGLTAVLCFVVFHSAGDFARGFADDWNASR